MDTSAVGLSTVLHQMSSRVALQGQLLSVPMVRSKWRMEHLLARL